MPRTVGHNALVRDVWKVVAAGDDDIGSRNLRVAEMIVNDDGKSNLPILAASGNAILKHLNHIRSNLADMKVRLAPPLHLSRTGPADLRLTNHVCEQVPFHVIHGKRDLVIDPECSQELIDRALSTDKSVTWLEEAWHELLFEPEWEQIINTMSAWMTARARA
jgi:alpha-beta hydrolase superfamily lysophospholipase